MSTSFIIIISVILVAQIITLLLSITRVPFVKAGDVSEKCNKHALVSNRKIKTLLVNGEYVSTTQLSKYVVHGNSMSPYGVKDGDLVFVQPSNSDILDEEKKYPIVLFKYNTDKDSECDIKLRKFLSFIDIDNIDIQNLFDQYGKQHVSLEQFTKDIEDRIAKIKEQESIVGKRYILSITYLYKIMPTRYHYSIHNADKVCGVVRYVA